MSSDINFEFKKEQVPIDDWEKLDFSLLKVPEQEIPSYPCEWVVDQNGTTFFITLKPSIGMMRDWLRRARFFMENTVFRVNIDLGNPLTADWGIPSKDFDRENVQTINDALEAAIRVNFSVDENEEVKIIVGDRWREKPVEELVTTFNLKAKFYYGSDNIKNLQEATRKLKEAQDKSWVYFKYLVWRGPKKVNLKKIAHELAMLFTPTELENVLQHNEKNRGEFYKESNAVADTLRKYNIKGTSRRDELFNN